MGLKFVISAIILGILGLVFCICGLGINEITRYNTDAVAIWCGWDGYGVCTGNDCGDADIVSRQDDIDYTKWKDVDPAEDETDAYDRNTTGGLVWVIAMIAGCVFTFFGIILLFNPTCREYAAPWCFILAFIAGCVALVGYLTITNMEGACMDRENLEYTPAVSSYAAIIGILFYFFAAVAACGAKTRR